VLVALALVPHSSRCCCRLRSFPPVFVSHLALHASELYHSSRGAGLTGRLHNLPGLALYISAASTRHTPHHMHTKRSNLSRLALLVLQSS
jgi:hypothetical protein